MMLPDDAAAPCNRQKTAVRLLHGDACQFSFAGIVYTQPFSKGLGKYGANQGQAVPCLSKQYQIKRIIGAGGKMCGCEITAFRSHKAAADFGARCWVNRHGASARKFAHTDSLKDAAFGLWGRCRRLPKVHARIPRAGSKPHKGEAVNFVSA